MELLAAPRVVAFISVEWSIYERAGRPVFADLAGRLAEEHAGLGIACWLLSEDWDGMSDWFAVCKLSSQVAGGYGAVVWLDRGRVVGTEEYAARAGLEELLRRTLELLGVAEPGAAADRGNGAGLPGH